MKKILIIALFTMIINGFHSLMAQSYNVNNNQQQININVPVIEKPVYIERYRTVYVNKPRVARKLDKPVLLLGYLWVYPEDLGNFKKIPIGVINSVNAQKPYGRDNWRIPTPDELAVLEANADRIGLGDDIYLATDHCNGVLRLVSIDGENTNYVKVGNTYWMKTNLGAYTEKEPGSLLSYENAVKYCPEGYRLPTKEEYDELLALNKACFGGKYGADENSYLIYLPYVHEYFHCTDALWGSGYYIRDGFYWIKGGKYLYFDSDKDKPHFESSYEDKCAVRYVLDK